MGEWKRGGSDEVLKKGKVIEAVSVVEAIKKAFKKSGGKNGFLPTTTSLSSFNSIA